MMSSVEKVSGCNLPSLQDPKVGRNDCARHLPPRTQHFLKHSWQEAAAHQKTKLCTTRTASSHLQLASSTSPRIPTDTDTYPHFQINYTLHKRLLNVNMCYIRAHLWDSEHCTFLYFILSTIYTKLQLVKTAQLVDFNSDIL